MFSLLGTPSKPSAPETVTISLLKLDSTQLRVFHSVMVNKVNPDSQDLPKQKTIVVGDTRLAVRIPPGVVIAEKSAACPYGILRGGEGQELKPYVPNDVEGDQKVNIAVNHFVEETIQCRGKLTWEIVRTYVNSRFALNYAGFQERNYLQLSNLLNNGKAEMQRHLAQDQLNLHGKLLENQAQTNQESNDDQDMFDDLLAAWKTANSEESRLESLQLLMVHYGKELEWLINAGIEGMCSTSDEKVGQLQHEDDQSNAHNSSKADRLKTIQHQNRHQTKIPDLLAELHQVTSQRDEGISKLSESKRTMELLHNEIRDLKIKLSRVSQEKMKMEQEYQNLQRLYNMEMSSSKTSNDDHGATKNSDLLQRVREQIAAKTARSSPSPSSPRDRHNAFSIAQVVADGPPPPTEAETPPALMENVTVKLEAPSEAVRPQAEVIPFDEEDYKKLRKFFLQKRFTSRQLINDNGTELRAKETESFIDHEAEDNVNGYVYLKEELDRLEQENDHRAIYRHLYVLNLFIQKKGPFPDVGPAFDDVTEIDMVDMTGTPDDDEIIDVDGSDSDSDEPYMPPAVKKEVL